MITLIIKAQDEMLARAAAGKNRVHIEHICPMSRNEIKAHANDRYMLNVQQWFNEPWPETGPFPVGTLLFYSAR